MPPPKRRYQPTLTTYLHRQSLHRDPLSPTTANKNNTPHKPKRPDHTLPTHVQSNLLNVGMRVRKAIPEGYKTSAAKPASSADKAHPRPAELAPFCGLDCVGGFGWGRCGVEGVENASVEQRGGADESMEVDEDLTPWVSQETGATGVSVESLPSVADRKCAGNTRKRTWEEDEEAEGEMIGVAAAFPAPHIGFAGRRGVRAGGRRRQMRVGGSGVGIMPGCEEVDFGEAAFLRPL